MMGADELLRLLMLGLVSLVAYFARESLREIKADVKGLVHDVGELKVDVAGIRSDVDNLKGRE